MDIYQDNRSRSGIDDGVLSDFRSIGLDDDQINAVAMAGSQTLLIAVPGSGAKETFLARIWYLFQSEKIDPRLILSIVPSDDSVMVMDQKYADLFGKCDNCARASFYTPKSVASWIVERYKELKDEDVRSLINDEQIKRDLLTDIMFLKLRREPKQYEVNQVLKNFSIFKNMMLSDSAPRLFGTVRSVENISDLYEGYQNRLAQMDLMDDDDLILFAINCLKSDSDFYHEIRKSLRYITVYEAHNMTALQHELINTIVGVEGNLFMIGDENQCIGGYSKALTTFQASYPNATVLFLNKNRSSTKSIVKAASRFINKKSESAPKMIIADRQEDVPIQRVKISKREDQYPKIASLAVNSNSSIAVLYKSSESSIPLIDYLLRNNVPFYVKRPDASFFEDVVVLDVCALIRLAVNEKDKDAFLHLAHHHTLDISSHDVEKVFELSAGKDIGYMSAYAEIAKKDDLNKLMSFAKRALKNPSHLISTIIRSGYGDYLTKHKIDQENVRLLKHIAKREQSITSFLDRLEFLKSELQYHNYTGQNDRIVLSTIYDSREDEFGSVVLLDTVDGVLPTLTKKQLSSDNERAAYREERRMFYVAMTRTRDKLYTFNVLSNISSFESELFLFDTEFSKLTVNRVKKNPKPTEQE